MLQGSKGDPLDRVHSDLRRFSSWSGGGGWTLLLEGKSLKLAQGTIRLKSFKIRWFPWRTGRRLVHVNGGPTRATFSSGAQMRIGNNWAAKKPNRKQAEWQLKQETTYSFSWVLMKEDWLAMKMMMSENRSSRSQVHVIVILGTDESLLRTQFK
jgi:hypothetical protein